MQNEAELAERIALNDDQQQENAVRLSLDTDVFIALSCSDSHSLTGGKILYFISG